MSDGGAQHIVLGPFFTSAKVLYPSIKVYLYDAGTTNDKSAWSDEDKSTAVAQPFVGDTTGIARFFADGDYRIVIRDSSDDVLDNAIDWDNVKITSDTATMWEGGFGTSYPSATAANRWQMFALVTAGNKLVFVGVNDGTAFRNISQPIGIGADVASTATLPVVNDGSYADVTGTTTITSFASLGVGRTITLQFDGVLTLTHHATNLILPSGNNVVTKAGDVFTFIEYASGDYRLISSNRPLDSKGADIASASALPVLAPGTFDVTGTTGVTSINSIGIGSVIHLQFDGALTLTHHATNLILPSGFDMTTQAGNILTFMEYAAGDWMLLSMNRGLAGGVVQAVHTQNGTLATGTTLFVNDDTTPQITEGDEYMTLAIIPTNALNNLVIEVTINASHGAAGGIVTALFQDTTANALAASYENVAANNSPSNMVIRHEMAAGTTSSTTFRVRIGGTIAGTTSFNGQSGAQLFNGVMNSTIRITEVQI